MAESASGINVGDKERVTSTVMGGALALYGLSRRSVPGALLALVGGALLYRGATGHCHTYAALGVNTADKSTRKLGEVGIKVEHSVTINRSPDELYQFWRNFENLPQFMKHLEAVTVQGDTRSRWVAKAPAGRTVEWDAEIINEVPARLIAWQSLPDADVTNAGSVRFEPAPVGRGTEVHVSLSYSPPAGKAGALVARLMGEEPQQQVEDDLRHFKQLMEAGEIPTTEGQPQGPRSAKGAVLDKIQFSR